VDYDCTIGDGVKIHCNCYVAQYSTIEDDVFLAPGVVLANDPHPGAPDPKRCMKGPTIRRGAQIGCNVTILPAVVIGEHALIGAGSVVTRDIPARSLAYGNPARVVKTLDQVRCRARDHRPYDFLFA
jgi:acetyltransferase-like isoleucine patch superfamily enzyme